MKYPKLRWASILLLLCAAAPIFWSCSSDDNEEDSPTANTNANYITDGPVAARLEIPKLKGGVVNMFLVKKLSTGAVNFCIEWDISKKAQRWTAFRWDNTNSGGYVKREDNFIEDTDIPAARWQTAPTNNGKWNFPFRIIGDSVWVDENDHSKGKKLVTQGRYTVFHVPSDDYKARKDPPSKAPMLYPPQNKDTETYAVDLSVYYDNLPLSMKNINQVDIDKLDTMQNIIEPTLSLREVYELHPWTEMADIMEGYKDTIASDYRNQKYMEDHVVMAPLGNRLLLKTEQRYSYDNVKKGQHSESLLGYYMKDDNWASMSSTPDPITGITRQDTMIWCVGWDAECKWYTYDPKTKTYTLCTHTVTEANDFLDVPKKTSITAGKDADTVIYCLRARSITSPAAGPDPDKPVLGAYWFNICRYTIIYHRQPIGSIYAAIRLFTIVLTNMVRNWRLLAKPS